MYVCMYVCMSAMYRSCVRVVLVLKVRLTRKLLLVKKMLTDSTLGLYIIYIHGLLVDRSVLLENHFKAVSYTLHQMLLANFAAELWATNEINLFLSLSSL